MRWPRREVRCSFVVHRFPMSWNLKKAFLTEITFVSGPFTKQERDLVGRVVEEYMRVRRCCYATGPLRMCC